MKVRSGAGRASFQQVRAAAEPHKSPCDANQSPDRAGDAGAPCIARPKVGNSSCVASMEIIDAEANL